jgi:hypothetical protein
LGFCFWPPEALRTDKIHQELTKRANFVPNAPNFLQKLSILPLFVCYYSVFNTQGDYD